MRKCMLSTVTACMLIMLCWGWGLADGRSPMTLTVANVADAVKLDPAFVTDTPTETVTNQIFDRLVRRDRDGNIVPGLATNWDVSTDGTAWVFRLRKGVKFHDGTPFNAEAVVFAYTRLKDPDLASPGAKDVMCIKEIKALDELTVRMTLTDPQAGFLDRIVMCNRTAIVSPSAVRKWGKDFAAHPVGTGPFKFAEWIPDTRVVLARNEDYFLGAPKLERLVFRPIPDAETQLIELETGGVDMILKVQPSNIERLKNSKNLTLHSLPDYSACYIFMNCSKFPFNDVRVRKAMNHAIPVDQIRNVMLKDAVAPLDSALPTSTWAYSRPETRYDHNPKKAAAFLKEAGFVLNKQGILEKDGKPLAITFYSPDGRYLKDKEIASVTQEALRELGIKVSIKVMEWGAYLSAVDGGEHEMCLLGWSQGHPDPSYFLDYQFKSQASGGWANDMFYDDPVVDDLLTKAAGMLEPDARKPLYHQVLEQIAKNAPMIPVYSAKLTYATGSWVKGYEHSVSTFDLLGVTNER